MKKNPKRISLYDEIIEAMHRKLEDSKMDGHYKEDAFETTRGAVHHALASLIGNVKAIKGLRGHAKKRKKK